MPEDRLPEIGGVVDGLIPRDLSDALDLAVKEERPRMLRRILRDLVRKAGIALGKHEATVRVMFLPGAVKHLILDFVMLGPSLAPSSVQRLVQILDKVGRLAQDERHLIETSPETNHLSGVGRKSLERVGGAARGGWRRPAERH